MVKSTFHLLILVTIPHPTLNKHRILLHLMIFQSTKDIHYDPQWAYDLGTLLAVKEKWIDSWVTKFS